MSSLGGSRPSSETFSHGVAELLVERLKVGERMKLRVVYVEYNADRLIRPC